MIRNQALVATNRLRPGVQRTMMQQLAAANSNLPLRTIATSVASLSAASATIPNSLRSLSTLPHAWRSSTTSFRPLQHLRNLTSASGGIPRSMLASREAAANRSPGSATAQNSFYQLLLKANMPAIVIERYQSGLYATDGAANETYARALRMVKNTGASDNQYAMNETAQAVGQSVAARSVGGSVASIRGGAGTKSGPLYVVVDESRSSTLFRWVKFLLSFGLSTYLGLVVISLAVSLFDDMNKRRPGNKTESEVKPKSQTTRFGDVHGCEEAKDELQELVDFLKNPDKFSTLGGKLPKGVLLVGPPGTGKTLLARAVAGEAGVPFFYMSGSEFDEIYVGVGAKRVRELFAAAKSKSPAIVFIDELDAIGGRRNARDAAYVKQTLNQLLTELDGFEQNSGVIILAATNFPELLDKALTRPGRFDRHVTVPLPDVRGRLAILNHHVTKIKAAPDVNLQALASSTSGLSGAELENIVNQAAIHASRAKAKNVNMLDFEWAKDRVIMGSERRSMVISAKEKEMTAYHEAGHALVLLFAENPPNELYKVTILPRGPTLGHTAFLPEMDKHSYTLSDYLSMIRVSLGGKMAEELRYGVDHVTSGVSSDLEKATKIAFSLVSQFGMSQKLGNMDYSENYQNLSSETKSRVEGEVQRMLNESYENVRELLTKRRKELDLLAQALVEYETLDRREVELVIRGQSIPGRQPLPPGPMAVPLPLDGAMPGSGEAFSSEQSSSTRTPPPVPPAPTAPAS
ncbi:i-AAA protease yme1 [Ceratocystis pirilliformis]|uniref:I-AAA protease yme1 n=1 Tax=Ceratocystis pirilliformis TaxID=259994 RepID=A0ABR3YN22_9PEZI